MSSGEHIQNGDAGKLLVYNSLTRQKEEFVPQNGHKVLWYSCGPTVYDASHMGHARSYISFDILRRILKDYFLYDVDYVMNITDIDDKIIKRARQEHLYGEYCLQERVLSQTLQDVRSALQHLESKPQSSDPDKQELKRRTVEKVHLSLANIERSLEQGAVSITSQDSLLEESREVLSDWLDHQRGATVTDNSIFASLPRHWEEEFNKDMQALNVLPPDTLTRVSEYIPQIVAYILRILANGMAYESPGGSVYFDTLKFHQTPGHSYAKLVPEARGDTSSLEEGEGELTEGKEKRNPMDFALWKASKPGEPSWESPWGKGRPGWHIECSAMASDVLGSCLDIHTGGIDLKFPHHDNELAQSEAYFNNDCWVRYFLHSGHLKIQGCKMSKSLKNFVTIQEALQIYSADQLRLMFLLHSWKDTLDYSTNTMDMALKFQKLVTEFFLTVDDLLRKQSLVQEEGLEERPLVEGLSSAKLQVHKALCDNMDTRSCLDHLKKLISATNIYLRDQEAAKKMPCLRILQDIKDYIAHMLKMFGVNLASRTDTGSVNPAEIIQPYLKALAEFELQTRNLAHSVKGSIPEFSEAVLAASRNLLEDILPSLGVKWEAHDDPARIELVKPPAQGKMEELVLPHLEVMVQFREKLRQLARRPPSDQSKQVCKELLVICDKVRDDILPDLGVRLEDKEGQAPVIKIVGREALLRERQEKLKREEEERLVRLQKKLEQQKLQAERDAQKKVRPEDMFRSDPKYGKFDEKGMPTHDAAGKELSKGQLKKLAKLYQQQQARHQAAS